MEPTTTQLRDKYLSLSPDLQDSLFEMETAESIGKIGAHYNLGIGTGVLADEIGLVLLGLLHPKDFINTIADKLAVDRDTAKRIANDVNQQIFQKVRLSLRKLHHITDQDIVAPIAPPTSHEAPASPAGGSKDAAKVIVHETKPPEKAPVPPVPPSPIEPLLKMPHATREASQGKPPPVLKVSPPKEAPKLEIRPLEIRPIQGFEPAKPKTPAPAEISPKIQAGRPPVQSVKERGLEVMPASPSDIKKSPPPSPPPAPPAGLSFLKNDSYREKI